VNGTQEEAHEKAGGVEHPLGEVASGVYGQNAEEREGEGRPCPFVVAGLVQEESRDVPHSHRDKGSRERPGTCSYPPLVHVPKTVGGG